VEAEVPKTRTGKGKNGPMPSKMLQLSSQQPRRSLLHLRKGDMAVLDSIELPADDARRLMELGFLPGTSITAGQCAPGGDPRVFQVDGSEIALRRVTAGQLTIRTESKRTM
jgi:ferrous iron transport protein A